MQIEVLDDPGSAFDWDEFVEASPGATLGHAAAWAPTLRDAYGLSTISLVARANGALAGVLPLVPFRTLGGRRELVSIPFHDAAGILAGAPEAEKALLDAALERTRALGARALELRQNGPLAGLPRDSEVRRVNLVLPLESDEETQWKAFRAQVRNQTRKAEREGLTIASGTPEELLEDFYRPFCVNMRDLGSPVHARAFYAAAARHFGDRLRFVVARRGSRSVGGLVAIRYAGRVTVTWASTLRSERRRCPNNLIYWEAIRWAIARGAREFDFGRSPVDSGTYRFKRGWGAEERPLAWTRLDPAGQVLPLGTAADGALLERLAAVWSRLPLAATRWLGPRIRRFLAN